MCFVNYHKTQFGKHALWKTERDGDSQAVYLPDKKNHETSIFSLRPVESFHSTFARIIDAFK